MPNDAIQYAAGNIGPIHSRFGLIGFACAVAGACGILITMALIIRPISGPMGGLVRGFAPVLGAAVLLLWLAGIILGIIGIRERARVKTFAMFSLGVSVITAELFIIMLSFWY